MEHEQVAEQLIAPLWRGLDSAYKSRYARNIWQQFEDAIRSAAYTSKLSTWYDTMLRKLSISLRRDDMPLVQAILTSDNDRSVLKMLRDETALLVLFVRVANEERKAARKAEDEAAQGTFLPTSIEQGDLF